MTADQSIDWVSAQTMLLTNRGLRDSFRLDPATTARKLKIRQPEIELFVTLNPDQLDAQADTLVQKRFHEVAKLLPLTVAALGENARELFRNYSTSYWPEGHQRHLLDAVRFASYLEHLESKTLCYSEMRWVRFVLAPKKFSVRPTVLRRETGRKYLALQILTSFRCRLNQRFLYLAIPFA